jgi:hypothetical protein
MTIEDALVIVLGATLGADVYGDRKPVYDEARTLLVNRANSLMFIEAQARAREKVNGQSQARP